MRTILLIGACVVLLFAESALACATCGCATKKAVPETKVSFIDAAKLQTLIKDNKDILVINVLDAKHYAKAHIKGSINVPLKKLHKYSEGLKDKGRLIVVYCANTKCHASTEAAKLLIKHGFTNVHDYKGGIKDWQEKKLPTATAIICAKCKEAKGSPVCCK